MISLSAIEEFIFSNFTDGIHATICLSDARKGEQIVLATTNPNIDREELSKLLKQKGLSELHLPKHILHLAEIPIFSTGKTNYPALTELAKHLQDDLGEHSDD
jgi:acyl-[acyl-carrier-protein]-phospholipid O-acyltransferase/long-chain-fatty-acid--[acyl-carrier-protein] ligase